MGYYISILFILAFVFGQIHGQSSYPNNCKLIRKCDECIGTEGCVWCSNPDFQDPSGSRVIGRCDTIDNHNKRTGFGRCGREEWLEVPRTKHKITLENPVVQNQNREVHISPQEASVDLAVGQPVTFTLTYLEDMDKKLDLYYIMDLSYTMMDDKDSVAREGAKMATELKKLTKDVRFGFGSFVDKPLIPFASYIQITNPTKPDVKTYGFTNHLSLTENIDEFQKRVKDAKISANLDMPEGGFDALMQAIVCPQIGWRQNETHKLIVIASDGPFHIAGDGKLGGVVLPNDMQCHLDRKGSYTHSTLLDYPSVGQIAHVLAQNKTRIIFAVTNDHVLLYTQLSERLGTAFTKVGILNPNSDNVVKLVRDQYNSLRGTVELRHHLSQKQLQNVEVSYLAKCSPNEANPWDNIPQSTCQNVGPGAKIQFRVTLSLKKCPEVIDGNDVGEIVFTTVDLKGAEQFRIRVNLKCSCNCTQKGEDDLENKAALLKTHCGGHAGHFQCGLCGCNQGRSGDKCECSTDGRESSTDTNACRANNGSDIDCSGNGGCKCSQCECLPSWDGRFCECPKHLCYTSPDIICADGGSCDCGVCKCHQDRGGDKCQCGKERTGCLEPGNEDAGECTGHGKCTCGERKLGFKSLWDWHCPQSECDSGHTGEYCHICKGVKCPPQKEGREGAQCRNKALATCVKCHLDTHAKMVQGMEACTKLCTHDKTDTHGFLKYDVSVAASTGDVGIDGVACLLPYNETCKVPVIYRYTPGDRTLLEVKAGTMLVCTQPFNYLLWGLAVAVGVLLIGLLTILLWKVFTHCLDVREFQRFENERAAAKWAKGENPLYSTPLTTVQNPAYRKSRLSWLSSKF